MRAVTKNCRKYGHPEFSLPSQVETFLVSYLESLIAWLESEVAAGKRFLPDQTVEMGWSVLKVCERENGTLALFEPDFKSMPIHFADSISKTLLHLFLQKSVAQSLGLEDKPNLPSLRQSAIVCTEFGTSKKIFLSRVASEGNDSGWFFGCDGTDHDHQRKENLRKVSLYEAAAVLDGRVIPYLGLPEGIEINIGTSAPSFSIGGKELKIKLDSYLDQLYRDNEFTKNHDLSH